MKHREVDKLLQNQDLPHYDRQKLINRLSKTIEHNEQQPQNRDGRGVRQSVRKLERTTVKHVASALRFSQNHADPHIRHKAKEFLRSIPHHSFPTLATRASSFMGIARKASRRLKEQSRQKNGRVIAITETLSLEEVRSLTLLQRVGKLLRLCVSDYSTARNELEDVLDGSEELWVVRYLEDIAGLLRVRCRQSPWTRRGRCATDAESRVITECNGYDNAPLVLSHDVALKILKCLQINQIDAETFALVGAFPIFLDDDIKHPIPEPICDGTKRHHVWRTKNHVVIATSKKHRVENNKFFGSKMQWSYFLLNNQNDWDELVYTNHLDLGKVMNLMLDVPGFDKAMKQIRSNWTNV